MIGRNDRRGTQDHADEARQRPEAAAVEPATQRLPLIEEAPPDLPVRMQMYIVGGPFFRFAQHLVGFRDGAEGLFVPRGRIVGMQALRKSVSSAPTG